MNEPLFVEQTPSTCPFEAARVGDLDALRDHLQGGKVAVNDTDCDKRTLIHWAAVKGNVSVVEYLIAQNANPNSIDDDRK